MNISNLGNLSVKEWIDILGEHPELEEKCDKFDDFSDFDWLALYKSLSSPKNSTNIGQTTPTLGFKYSKHLPNVPPNVIAGKKLLNAPTAAS